VVSVLTLQVDVAESKIHAIVSYERLEHVNGDAMTSFNERQLSLSNTS
jgi:hypothetical protein